VGNLHAMADVIIKALAQVGTEIPPQI